MACLQGEVQMACPVPDRLIGDLPPQMTVWRWLEREAAWLSRWPIRVSNASGPELINIALAIRALGDAYLLPPDVIKQLFIDGKHQGSSARRS